MSGRVLVVDRVEAERARLARRLRGEGYEIEVAGRGGESLAVVESGRVGEVGGLEVVVLDATLPDMSGLEVLRRLRKRYSLLDLPVIVFSNRADESLMLQALEAGANDHVTMPVSFRVLVGRLEVQLRVARQARALAGTAAPVPSRPLTRPVPVPGARVTESTRLGVSFGRPDAGALVDIDALVVHPDDVEAELLADVDRPYLLAWMRLGDAPRGSVWYERMASDAAILRQDANMGIAVADLASPRWRARLLEEHFAELHRQGFDGLVLDTLDTVLGGVPHQFGHAAAPAQHEGLKSLLTALRLQWPDCILIGRHPIPVPEMLIEQLDAVTLDSLTSGYALSRSSRRPTVRGMLRSVRVARGRPLLTLSYR